jgi:hypothetical protein
MIMPFKAKQALLSGSGVSVCVGVGVRVWRVCVSVNTQNRVKIERRWRVKKVLESANTCTPHRTNQILVEVLGSRFLVEFENPKFSKRHGG